MHWESNCSDPCTRTKDMYPYFSKVAPSQDKSVHICPCILLCFLCRSFGGKYYSVRHFSCPKRPLSSHMRVSLKVSIHLDSSLTSPFKETAWCHYHAEVAIGRPEYLFIDFRCSGMVCLCGPGYLECLYFRGDI